jgi:hypothetical protein
MTSLIRFKPVEIDSKVYFIGKKKKLLNYPVRSISLVPEPKSSNGQASPVTVPEIFWQ